MRKKWCVFAVLLVCLGLFCARYASVNKKYPGPFQYKVGQGESFTYHNVDITVTDAKITGSSQDESRAVEVTYQLSGEAGDQFDLTRTAVVDGLTRAVPLRDELYEQCGGSRVRFDEKETITVTLSYPFVRSNYFASDWAGWDQRNFEFVLVDTYPVEYKVSLPI